MATKRPEPPFDGSPGELGTPAEVLSGESSPDAKSAKLDLDLTDADKSSAIRTSARVQRMKVVERSEFTNTESKNEINDSLDPSINGQEKGQQKRTWEQWSSEDKAIFFEALNECGKNFESIQTFFQTRKKNSPNFKNKEQIRTFYYRTWHKICKYVDFPDKNSLKKSSKELYGLINFGELRKRLGSQLDDKTGFKLRELIFKGHTTVRIKGKTHRLRTPTCPALKRLTEQLGLHHQKASIELQPSSSSVSVPSKLSLGLSPATTDDFDRVHRRCLANPHVTFSLRPGRSLASVMEHLSQKWKNNMDNNEEQLWLIPKPGAVSKWSLPKISVIEPTKVLSLSNLKGESELVTATASCSDDPSNNDNNIHETKTEVIEEVMPTEQPAPEEENGSCKPFNFEEGWNTKMAHSITIGELFLMADMGPGSTQIDLQYTWKKSTPSSQSTLSILAKMATSELSKKKGSSSNSSVNQTNSPKTPVAKLLTFEGPNSPVVPNGSSSSAVEEAEFRRPTVPVPRPTTIQVQQHQAFKQQLENLMPRYNMRKGRPLSRSKRPLVNSVSSHRPLQPAPSLKLSDGKVKLRLLPAGITVTHPIVSIQSDSNQPQQLTPSVQSSSTAVDIDTNSNDSLSSALAYFDNRSSSANTKADQFLDSVFENSNSSVLQTPPRVRPTPPTSPSRAVSNDSWLPDLSSFLHLNSNSNTPTKAANLSLHHAESSKMSLLNEDSVQSTGSEVDRQLLSMMTESSVDFTSKFARLASAVVGHSEEMQ